MILVTNKNLKTIYGKIVEKNIMLVNKVTIYFLKVRVVLAEPLSDLLTYIRSNRSISNNLQEKII